MTACLGQVHIVMQIAYGLTNADEIVVRLRPSYSVMRWRAMHRGVRTYVKLALRALSCFMPFASAPCSALHFVMPGLADGHGLGRQGRVKMCAPSTTKQRWTVRPPLLM